MASATADSVFAGAGGGTMAGGAGSGGSGGGEGGEVSPDAALPGWNAIVGTGAKGDRTRLTEDPFVKAAEEQKKTAQEALDKAAGLQTTTDETGTQTTAGTTAQTSQTTFAPKSKTEQELQNASIANYKKQQGLVADQEAAIKARSGVQGQARDSLGNVLGGQAFDLSAGEEARINRLRAANIDVGSNAVNALLTERLGEVSADAARRGLRGQAFTQLQGDVLGEAAISLERTTLDANRIAGEQAISLPGQRAGIQAQTAGQFAGFADELNQQAIQNRQSLQDPVALQQMLDERLKGGKTESTGATSDTTTSAGKSTQTGVGQAEILAGMAGLPGKSAAKTGAFGTIFGSVMGASGGG